MGKFFTKLIKSFGYAIKGIQFGFADKNMKIHGVAAVLAIFLSFYYQLSWQEWLYIVIAICIVLSAELFNSSIENMADIVRDELKLDYKATQKLRDMAAGAVLIVTSMAAIIGLVIFLPKII